MVIKVKKEMMEEIVNKWPEAILASLKHLDTELLIFIKKEVVSFINKILSERDVRFQDDELELNYSPSFRKIIEKKGTYILDQEDVDMLMLARDLIFEDPHKIRSAFEVQEKFKNIQTGLEELIEKVKGKNPLDDLVKNKPLISQKEINDLLTPKKRGDIDG